MEWAPAVTAIATSIIALVAVGLVVAAIPLLRQGARVGRSLEQLVTRVETDARPLIDSARIAVAEAGQMVHRMRGEVDAIVNASEGIRERVAGAADAAEDRLLDLEALLDVMQDEVEDTVLDVAAALRTTRRGTAILQAMKRTFLGSGKKRRRRR